MQTIGNPNPAPERTAAMAARRGLLSLALHGAAIAVIALSLKARPHWVAPYRLPGSPHGTNFVVAYLPDRAPEQAAAAHKTPESKPAPPVTPKPTPVERARRAPTPAVANTLASPNPDSATGADALGSGNITIALTAYFPPPHPDLTALPHGTRGDVILRVVIDTNGRISDMKMISGLGHGVDDTVIATVQQWVFHPALQNGRPVASEQELHFHYEHG